MDLINDLNKFYEKLWKKSNFYWKKYNKMIFEKFLLIAQ